MIIGLERNHFCAINASREYFGIIAPGIGISQEALYEKLPVYLELMLRSQINALGVYG